MKLNEKLTDICDWETVEWFPVENVPSMPSGTTIPAADRLVAWCRYIQYRCRKLVNSGERKDYGNLELTSEEIEKIDLEVARLKARLSAVESLFLDALRNDGDRLKLTQINTEISKPDKYYNHDAFKMVDPFTNRALFVWDIVWGLFAVYYEKLSPAIEPSATSKARSEARNLIFKNVERRLRKIERMRYNVSARLEGDDLPETGSGTDGHSLRIFEYPLEDEGIIPGDFWQHPTNSDGQITSKVDFVLTPRGESDPLAAIKWIFPDDRSTGWARVERRTFNYCDKVIHILHLEELAGHLIRNGNEGTASSSLQKEVKEGNPRRISIVSSFTSKGVIGSGRPLQDNPETEPDPYFEYLKDARMDELIPGDHIIVYSHPAFNGVSKKEWRLENALVTRIGGTTLPRDIEVQGHDLGPYEFGSMQHDLLDLFSDELKNAQNMITDVVLNQALDKHPNTPFKYDIERQPCFYERERDPCFEGVVEFRNEFANRRKGAFWARWVLLPYENYPLAQIDEFGVIISEFANDTRVLFGAYDLPIVTDLELDPTQRLLTLKGANLTQERIESVYFVSAPERGYSFDPRPRDDNPKPGPDDVGNGYYLYPNSEFGRLVTSHSGVEIVKLNTTNSPIEIMLDLPDSWPSQQDYWRPVLHTPLNIEVRAHAAFRWPPSPGNPNPIWPLSRPYNVAYFPLFEESVSGSGVFDRPTMARLEEIQEFYREHEPEHTIQVIRPRLEDLMVGD